MFKYNELSDLKNGELVTPLRKNGSIVICLNANGEEEEHVFSDFDITKKPEERIVNNDGNIEFNTESEGVIDNNDGILCGYDDSEGSSTNEDEGTDLNGESIGNNRNGTIYVAVDNDYYNSDSSTNDVGNGITNNSGNCDDNGDDISGGEDVIISPTPNIPDNILNNVEEEAFEVPNTENNNPTLRQLGYRLKSKNSKVNIETRTVCVLKKEIQV